MNLLIVYDSLTGNTKKFVSKLNHRSVQITKDLVVDEPYILVTYTIGLGEIPPSTKEFLNRNSLFLLGVAGSGNRNWGLTYCKAVTTISKQYNVPIIRTFELSGTAEDITAFKWEVERLCQKIKFQNGSNITMK